MTSALEFGLRSCLSLGLLVFLCLFSRSVGDAVSQKGQHAIGLPFSAFACVLSLDSHLGGTVVNIVALLVGSAIASLACSIACLAFQDAAIPKAAQLALIFVLTFALNLLDLPPLGKRVGLSLIAINLMSTSSSAVPTSMIPWWLFQNVLFGCACGLFGLIFPWPRLASLELEMKTRSSALALGSVFESALSAWRRHHILLFQRNAASDEQTTRCPTEVTTTDEIELSKSTSKRPSRRWRLFKHVFGALLAIRRMTEARNRETKENPASAASSHCSSRAVRDRLRANVRDDLSVMKLRAAEARYGPHRHTALCFYADFVALLEELVLALGTIEARLARLDVLLDGGGQPCVITRAMMGDPDFRRALSSLGQTMRECLVQLGATSASALHECKALELALAVFDAEYHRVRMNCYYVVSRVPLDANVLLAMNGLVFHIQRAANQVVYFSQHLSKSREQKTMRFLFPRRPTRKLLLSSLTLSYAMTLTAFYGSFHQRSVPFLASFTVAYLSGGASSGVNVSTSLLRVAGTGVACLYALIIASLVASPFQDPFDQALYSSIATVVFLLPCTIVRAKPVVSYSGTVAAFSVALLLLAPLSVNVVVERLVDTIMGVSVFLAFELTVSRVSTEELILDALIDNTASLSPLFGSVLALFSAGAAGMATTGTGGAVDFHHQSCPGLSKQLLIFSSIEPHFVRRPLASSLLARSIDCVLDTFRHMRQLELIAQETGRLTQSFTHLSLHEHLELLNFHFDVAISDLLGQFKKIKSPHFSPLRKQPEQQVAQLLRHELGSPNVLSNLKKCENELLASFRRLVASLQINGDGDSRLRGFDMPNAEVELACAFLGVLLDLLAGLSNLLDSATQILVSQQCALQFSR